MQFGASVGEEIDLYLIAKADAEMLAQVFPQGHLAFRGHGQGGHG